MDGEPIKADLDSLYHMRMLILLECNDNKFRQIQVTPEQFEKIADFIIETSGEVNPFDVDPEKVVLGVRLRTDWAKPSDDFLGLQDSYDKDY